jgi:predicted ATPase/DNA-binding XRE family transcriptional regulator
MSSNPRNSLDVPPAGDGAPVFGTLLRRFRLQAGLSQEALAELSGISVEAVSSLERGMRKIPQRQTLAAIVRALQLDRESRRAFERAAIRPFSPRRKPPDPLAAGYAQARGASLPTPLSTFFGREAELDEVTKLLESARLLTIAGPGGIGKTRFSVALAQRISTSPEGRDLAYVPLQSLTDPELVSFAMLQALELNEEVGRSIVSTLIEKLRDRRELLIVDNCEHVCAACAQLFEQLLGACPNLQIVATSRVVLGVPGETIYRLSSLRQTEGVLLFADRARLVHHQFALTPANETLVSRLVRRLDGIPLAIELAAARSNVLSLETLEARLSDLLGPGNDQGTARHGKLSATMNWSYELLSPLEQQLFARLSIFPGDWSVEDVEHVCAGSGIEREQIVDLLASLIDKSLVVSELAADARRFRCLDLVRSYAGVKLPAHEAARLSGALLAWAMTLAESFEPGLHGAKQLATMESIEHAAGNFRLALRLSSEPGAAHETGLRLAAALSHYWLLCNNFFEGVSELEAALSNDRSSNAPVRIKALIGLGMLSLQRRDFERAQSSAQEAAALARACGDGRGVSHALGISAIAAVFLADAGRFNTVHGELCERAQRPEHPWIRALAFYATALRALRDGDHLEAKKLLEQALSIVTSLDDSYDTVTVSIQLAYVLVRLGDVNGAARLFFSTTTASLPFKNTGVIAQCTLGLACIAAALEQFDMAAELFGAEQALIDISATSLWRHWGTLADEYRTKTIAQLGESRFDASREFGYGLARHDMFAVVRRFKSA